MCVVISIMCVFVLIMGHDGGDHHVGLCCVCSCVVCVCVFCVGCIVCALYMF